MTSETFVVVVVVVVDTIVEGSITLLLASEQHYGGCVNPTMTRSALTVMTILGVGDWSYDKLHTHAAARFHPAPG